MKRFALIMSLMLVVAACSSDADDPTTTTAPASGTTETTTTTAAPSTTSTTAAPAETTTTTTAAPSSDLTTCVIGVWELDSATFLELIAAELAGEQGLGEFEFGGGSYSLTVAADGTFIDERSDWTLLVTSDFGDLQITINDRNEGTWTIDGDVLSTALQTGDAPEITFLLDGEPVEFPGGAAPVQPPAVEFTGATVTCSDDQLSASFEGFTSTWTRTG